MENKERIITVGFSGTIGGAMIASIASNTFVSWVIGGIIGFCVCAYVEYKSIKNKQNGK